MRNEQRWPADNGLLRGQHGRLVRCIESDVSRFSEQRVWAMDAIGFGYSGSFSDSWQRVRALIPNGNGGTQRAMGRSAGWSGSPWKVTRTPPKSQSRHTSPKGLPGLPTEESEESIRTGSHRNYSRGSSSHQGGTPSSRLRSPSFPVSRSPSYRRTDPSPIE